MKQSNSKAESTNSVLAESSWPSLSLERSKQSSLVEQIVDAITSMVNRRELRIGMKMPSVRQLAKCNGVSTFTVVEAYGQLVSSGLLSSRRGSGYTVARNESVISTQKLVFQATPFVSPNRSPKRNCSIRLRVSMPILSLMPFSASFRFRSISPKKK